MQGSLAGTGTITNGLYKVLFWVGGYRIAEFVWKVHGIEEALNSGQSIANSLQRTTPLKSRHLSVPAP